MISLFSVLVFVMDDVERILMFQNDDIILRVVVNEIPLLEGSVKWSIMSEETI